MKRTRIFLIAMSMTIIGVGLKAHAQTYRGYTDLRDGQTYATVDIGNQTWFAENLNYETTESWWYDNSRENGDIYGRLYTWDAAVNACPSGWHLPSDEEWKTMEITLGMSQSDANDTLHRGTNEGEIMKSTSGWSYQNANGTNGSGFNALPGGGCRSGGSFKGLGNNTGWWTSTEYLGVNAWVRGLSDQYNKVTRYYFNKTIGGSVRCIKD